MVIRRLALFASCMTIFGLLHGCSGGGGGSGNGGNGGGGTPPPPPSLPQFSLTEANETDVASSVIGSFEIGLIVADEAALLLQLLDGTAFERVPHHCQLGTATYAHIDADQDGKVSVGDSATTDYSSCLPSSTGRRLYGQLVVEVTGIDDSRGTDNVRYEGVVHVDAMSLFKENDDVSLFESFEFTYDRGVYESSISAKGSFSFDSTALSRLSHSWSNLTVTKSEHYESATYSVEVVGNVMFDGFTGAASVGTDTPLSGYLHTFPSTGTIKISAPDSSELHVSVNESEDRAARVLFNSGDGNLQELAAARDWSIYAEGYLWWYEPASHYSVEDVKTYDVYDFSILNRRPFDGRVYEGEESSVNPEIRFQMSRPVDPGSVQATEQLRVAVKKWGLTPVYVDADVEVRGALLIFRPVEQLPPHTYYRFPIEYSSISDMSGNNASYYSRRGNIATVDTVSSVASPDKVYAYSGDRVSIDGSYSRGEGDEDVEYQWEQIIGPPATIFDDDKEQAVVVLPNVTDAQLIRVRLAVTNEFGEYDYDSTDIHVFPEPSSTELVVTGGVHDDGWHSESMYSPLNGEQSYSFTDYSVIIENDTDYFASYRDDPSRSGGSDLWIRFVAGGSPLAVGVYDVAEDPEPRATSMMIRAQEGCDSGAGQFEVLELQKSPAGELEKLALDYTRTCRYDYNFAEVSGHVRINSDVPIPPTP